MASKQPKILNLDTLATTERTLTLGGVDYKIEDMTVENFIVTSRAAKKLIDENADQPTQVEETIEMIVRSIPSIPKDELRKLSLEKLGVIVQFVQGNLDDEEDPKAEGESAGKKTQD